MTISKRDYNKLCKIARTLNNADEEDIDFLDLWQELADVIERIEE